MWSRTVCPKPHVLLRFYSPTLSEECVGQKHILYIWDRPHPAPAQCSIHWVHMREMEVKHWVGNFSPNSQSLRTQESAIFLGISQMMVHGHNVNTADRGWEGGIRSKSLTSTLSREVERRSLALLTPEGESSFCSVLKGGESSNSAGSSESGLSGRDRRP